VPEERTGNRRADDNGKYKVVVSTSHGYLPDIYRMIRNDEGRKRNTYNKCRVVREQTGKCHLGAVLMRA
jgi:hypothetical protein